MMKTDPRRIAVEAEGHRLPPRSAKHPSHKGAWTRRFVQVLVYLFFGLVIGLMVVYARHPDYFTR